MITKNGRLPRLSLALFALIVLLMTACTQAAPAVSKPKLSSDPVVRWIQQNAIPLRTTNQGGSDIDLALLNQVVGQASIVGLGGATHSTHEIFDIKARVVEYLISHLGFTTFVMENGWGESQLLNAYINGGPGTLTNVMSQSLFESWQTQENEQMFAWMRAYNANPAHTTKIQFLGMDCAVVNQSNFDVVEQYVQTVAPSQATSVENLYAPIIANSLHGYSPADTASGLYDSLGASAKQQYQNQAQQVYNLLQENQQDFTARSSAQSFALALQNARIIVQFTTLYNATTPSEILAHNEGRDTFMAENVVWIHDHEAGNNPKIIIWAHDVHIANNILYPSPDGLNMGAELRAKYKESYLPIGTSIYQGAMRIYDIPGKTIQTIAPPAPDTYNYTLGQAGLPLYMLDLRKIPAGTGPVASWAEGFDSSSYVTMYGQNGQNVTHSFEPCELNQWFDVIIHIQNTTPAQHL